MGRFYLIIDSKQIKDKIELDTINYRDGYVRLKSDNLSKTISPKLYKKLLKRGLFKEKKDRDKNSYLALHRLVACLYDDITNLSIHHIDKDKSNNKIENLVPLEQEKNTSLDSLEYSEMLEIGQKEHQKWFSKINKHNETIANNPYLQFDILEKSLNISRVKSIYLLFKKKLKNIQTIRNIMNYFLHTKEFLMWLKDNNISLFKDLNKNAKMQI